MRLGKRVLIFAAAGALLTLGGFAASEAIADPPPGATAICVDGTYSYSQTRSGTCSHHGGVSVWLTPSAPASTAPPTTPYTPPATSTAAATTTAPAPAPATSVSTSASTTEIASTTRPKVTKPTGSTRRRSSHSPAVDVGHLILISARTKSIGCALSALPDRSCSPGGYSSKLTKAVLCSPNFHTGDVRNVPEGEKHQVEHEYGMAETSYGSKLEIDHIISLELGGSNNIANLFPERAAPAPGFRVKDKLENKLHDLVCAGQMTLHAAQVGIATNWETLYTKVYGVAP